MDLVLHLAKGEEEFLVWQGIKDSLNALVSIWWEDEVVNNLFMQFRMNLYAPLVAKLGYEYKETEAPSTKQLRTLAISAAMAANDPEQCGA